MSVINISLLYVEDEQTIRDYLSEMLSRQVAELHIAFDGKEGLELFKEKRPDVILTDIRMPIMNGLEMTKAIKAISQDVFIIVTSAYSEAEYFVEAIDMGVDNFLLKPVNKRKLKHLLQHVAKTKVMHKQLLEQETKRKKAEEEARNISKELHKVLSTVSDAIWSSETDTSGKFNYNYYSPGFEKITAREFNFFIGGPDNWKKIVHPDDVEKWETESRKNIKGEQDSFDLEYRIILPDDSVRWIRDRVIISKLPDNRIRLDGIFSDITIARQSEEKYSNLYDSLMQELQVAATLQSYLLPQWLTLHDKIIFSSIYSPSETVGGDLFDIIPISDTKFVVYLGDVSGHGVQAALLMTAVKSTVSMIVENEKHDIRPYFVTNRINNILSKEVFFKSYMTFLFCVVDLEENKMRYFNAGHPPIIQFDTKSNKAKKLPHIGHLPIGWIPEVKYTKDDESEVEINEDIITFLYTDGIFECKNRTGEPLEIDGFISFLEKHCSEIDGVILPQKFKSKLVDLDYNMTTDDFTLLSFRLRPQIREKEFFHVRSLLKKTSEIRKKADLYIIDLLDNADLGGKIELIVDEFVNNIIIHGLASKSDTLIVLEIDAIQDNVVLTIWDKGIVWDLPEKKKDEDLFADKEPYDTTGRGMPIIYLLCTEVKRRRYDEINETIFVLKSPDEKLIF